MTKREGRAGKEREREGSGGRVRGDREGGKGDRKGNMWEEGKEIGGLG